MGDSDVTEESPYNIRFDNGSRGLTSAEISEDIKRFGLNDPPKIQPTLNVKGVSKLGVGETGISALTTPTRKRRNEEPHLSNSSKKSLKNFQDTFSEVTRMTSIYITHKSHPQQYITKEGAQQIRHELNMLIDQEPDEGVEIKINSCKDLDGGLEVVCADTVSKNWVISKIQDLSKKLATELKQDSKIVSPYFTANVRVDFDVNEGSGSDEAPFDPHAFGLKVLKRLKRQNKRLNVKDWIFTNSRPTDRGNVGLIFRAQIPISDKEELKKTNGRIHYLCNCLRVNFEGALYTRRIKLGE